MFLVLLLLELLPFLCLLCLQLVLFLLVFLIRLCVPGVWSSRVLHSRKIARMDGWSAAGVLRTPTSFSAPHHAIALKISRSRSCNYSRLAVVERCALLWIRAGSLDMCGLCGYRPDMSFMCGSFFLRRRTRVNSTVAVETNVRIVPYVHVLVVNIVEVAAHMPN